MSSNYLEGEDDEVLLEALDDVWRMKRALRYDQVHIDFEKHDNTNFETTLAYTREENKTLKYSQYHIEFYFFTPDGVLPDNYTSWHFLKTISNNVRLESADISPSEFLDRTNPNSPLTRLVRYHAKLLETPRTKLRKKIIEDACSVANYIHFSIKNIRTSPRFSSKIHQRQHFTRELKLTKTLVSAFRSVLHDYQKNLSDQLATTLETLNVIDENISFSLEREWIKPLESQMLHEDALLRKSIQDFLSQELQYRERFTFLRAQPKGMTTEEKKEIFSYRLGLLKKFVQRNLYLDVTYETNNSYLVQSAAMFAAGIAAAFAYSIELLNRGHYRMDWSYDAGLLLFLSTFAYIIKDRIKDVIKSLFAKHFSSFDLRRNISLPSVSKKPFAHSLESVKVCRSKEIPKQILKKRNRTLLKGMKRHKHETVIYYSKLLSINWNVIQQPDRPPHNIIKEIHRFNLSKMFERMDNPVKSMKFYDPVTQQVVERTIPKVYHLNVVLSFTPVKGRKKTPIGKPSICKARLILNKEGIKRVEIDD